MSLSQEEITELKKNLYKEKERVENEINRITKPSLSGKYEPIFNEIGQDEDENASEVEEYTDNVAIENTLEKQLKEINMALDRIKSNSYGRCEKCGTEISTNRLQAYPAAKKCITC